VKSKNKVQKRRQKTAAEIGVLTNLCHEFIASTEPNCEITKPSRQLIENKIAHFPGLCSKAAVKWCWDYLQKHTEDTIQNAKEQRGDRDLIQLALDMGFNIVDKALAIVS